MLGKRTKTPNLGMLGDGLPGSGLGSVGFGG